MYFQINLGRNVGVLPMIDAAWQAFRDETLGALVALSIDLTGEGDDSLIEQHSSEHGHWAEQDEQSMHYSLFIPLSDIRTKGPETAEAVVKLRRELRRLADWYCQDSIALIASSSLIKGPQYPSPAARLVEAAGRNLI